MQSMATNVCALVERQVMATPDATALIVGEDQISYRTLWQRVLTISAVLQSKNLTPEEPVGIVLGRCLDLVASMLGIWHAGGAYLPIDPDDPAPRNETILRSAQCRLLLSDAVSMSMQQGLSDPVQGIEWLDVAKIAQPMTPIESRYSPGSALAYILFTSGSTGVPKGVQIEQCSVVHLLVTIRDLLKFTATDRYLATASAGFDISVPELFLPLVCGGSSLLRHRELWLSPSDLARDIRQFAITIVQAVPSTWALAFSQLPDFPRIRTAITTGEAITPQVARQLPQICDDAWNLYGPTETTVWATAQRLRTDISDGQFAEAPSIGFPLSGLTAVILDEAGNEVPVAAKGELCIGGIALARGYCGQELLTAERFPMHQGSRLYRTGDVASLEKDGSITCYGRMDDQLKIRGVRIEPGEIESVMQEHPDIQTAAATWFSSGDTSRVIAAAYVASKGSTPSLPSILNWVAARLPAQMIPAKVIRVDALPLSPSGKIDRAAIRNLIQQQEESAAESEKEGVVTLISHTEAVIADAWRRILQRKNVSREDHFFDSGGDSLAAVRVLAQIESILGVRLPIRSVFEAPTLAALAELVDRTLLKRELDPEQNTVFELARVKHSRPIFTCNFDLQFLTDGNWKSPTTLYAILKWADENAFLKSSTLEAFARIQLAGIRKRQPVGPYRLAGYGFGALIALEIARQLEYLGENVEILFLIQPVKPSRVTTDQTGMVHHDPAHSARTNGVDRQASQFSRLVQWLSQRFGWLQYHLAHLRGRNKNPIAETLVPKHQWPFYWHQSRRLVRQYTVRPYLRETILISAMDAQSREIWQKVLPSLKILECAEEEAEENFGRPDWRTLLGTAIREIDGTSTH
jgi:amino acid adenylation domain-containing protein